jgi:ketosteroid isomerase-like protein
MTTTDFTRGSRPRSLDDLADTAEITDAMNEYCDTVDECRLDELMAIFTSDCVYDFGLGLVLRGHAELRAYLVSRLDKYSSSTHHVTNVRIHLGDERTTAAASSYVYARSQWLGTEFTSELWGRYFDEWLKGSDGVWRMSKRTLRAAANERFPLPEGKTASFEYIDRDRGRL